MGEVLALNPIIRELVKNYNLILTTVTDTGKTVAERNYGHLGVKVYYLPFDLDYAIRRFLRKTKPKALLIAETELWPNLILVTSRYIPVALINGRLSDRSYRRYHRFRFIFREILQRFTFIALQEELYQDRFLSLGIKRDKIFITGNLKFDLIIEEKSFPKLEFLKRPIIIAGSTHPPEEELILKAFLDVVKEGTLILVPRHPQRFDEVEYLIKREKPEDTAFFRYSLLREMEGCIPHHQRAILLFDEMGLLKALYSISDIAIIGGSFIPHGGQNPLEAIYWEKPVITGPHMENFPFVEEFQRVCGLLKVSKEELPRAIKSLLDDRAFAKEVATKGYNLWIKKRGATEKTLELIRNLLNS